MRIRNTANGPRGVFTLSGLVSFEAGEAKDVELSKAEADGLAPHFKAEGGKPAEKSSDDAPSLSVLAKGRGWFVVVDGSGAEVTKSLRADDVEGFSDMSEADQAAFVELHQPQE